MGHSSLGEELNGCKVVSLLGQMIVQDSMNHHGKTPCCDGLDCALSHPILVMSIDATKAILFDTDVEFVYKLLKGGFDVKGVSCIQGDLIVMEDKGAGMVSNDGTTTKILGIGFFSLGMRKTSMDLQFILIHGHCAPKLENSL
eukprot:6362747-Ditylum_brightwellii.AAC.1